jgi:hypothetical protein
MTVGLETSTDTAEMIAPAGAAGVVALKPTVGRVSRSGVLGVAKSQDSPGPITRTVYDAALQLQAIAGPDADDPATASSPTVPNYVAGLSAAALSGKRVAVVSSTTAPYPSVLTTLTALGATTAVKTVANPSPNPASIVQTEFKRDLNAYLSGVPGDGAAKSLQQIIDYNNANPVEGLKYQQGTLLADQAIDLGDPATAATYESNKSVGKASSQAVIDNILNNGTPADSSDDFDVVVVPSGNGLVGTADRAGYPVLTVPAGYGTGSTGRNPIGVTFVGGAFSEATLLADGYAFEQATNVRLAPSFTNPSMWRCVPYSTFFSPHHCNAGDLESGFGAGPTQFPVATSIGGTVSPTLELTLGSSSTSLGSFIPGETASYSASLAASLTSTGGDTTLEVSDPSPFATGHLVNGPRWLPQALQVRAHSSQAATNSAFAPLGTSPLTLLTYSGPVSTDPITIGFKQSISENDALRTGTYGKTLLLTASTNTP